MGLKERFGYFKDRLATTSERIGLTSAARSTRRVGKAVYSAVKRGTKKAVSALTRFILPDKVKKYFSTNEAKVLEETIREKIEQSTRYAMTGSKTTKELRQLYKNPPSNMPQVRRIIEEGIKHRPDLIKMITEGVKDAAVHKGAPHLEAIAQVAAKRARSGEESDKTLLSDKTPDPLVKVSLPEFKETMQAALQTGQVKEACKEADVTLSEVEKKIKKMRNPTVEDVGKFVVIYGCTKDQEFNSQAGWIIKYQVDDGVGWFTVDLGKKGDNPLFKAIRLFVIDMENPYDEKHVGREVYVSNSSKEENGKKGIIKAYDEFHDKDKFNVKIDGEWFARLIESECLQMVEPVQKITSMVAEIATKADLLKSVIESAVAQKTGGRSKKFRKRKIFYLK